MPARSTSTRSQEPRDRDDFIAAAPVRAVGKETRSGDLPTPSPLAPFSRTRLGSVREPWAESEVTDALGLAPDQAAAPAASALDAMAAASPAEVQLARSLVQLGLAHLQILQTTLLDAYHRAVSALDAPAVRDLALQLVSGVAQVENARDQIGPGDELEPLRTELDAAWQAAVSQLAVQVSPQVLGGALVTSGPEPPPRAHVVHLGAELVSREAGRVLELLEAAERIRSYVMPEGASTSEAATPGDQLLAVIELERFTSRPIDALFLVAMLKRTGAWLELAQARGGDGRTAAQVLGNAYAQAAETGATVDLGSQWNAQEATDALSYGLTDWAVTDEEATRIIEMLQAASPQGRAALVKQLHRQGLLDRLVANVGWFSLQQIGETLNDPEAEALLSPHYEGKGGVPSSHELFMAQVDRNLEEGSALDTFQAGAWYLLDSSLDSLSFGGKSSIDRAHEARDAGLISEDAFWAESNKAMLRTAAIGGAAVLTGGAAGAWSEGAALTLGAGEGGAAIISGAVGGAVGNVGARFTGDVYDQLLRGKEGFDSFSTYAQDFATGGLFGTALAPLGLHAAKHLPASARTMAQTYAVHHPHMIPMLEAARAAGAGAAFRVRMTVREWLEISKSTGGPGSMGGLRGLQPAFSSGSTGADSALGSLAASPDLGSLPPDVELWITARPTVDLDAPIARLGDEDVPWFEVEAVEPGASGEPWRVALGEEDPSVQSMHEFEPLGNEPHRQRLPIAKEIDPSEPVDTTSSGFWTDEHARGNVSWYSDNQTLNKVTEYEPVRFKDNYPVFDDYVQQTVYLKNMVGNKSDFARADRELARRYAKFKADGSPDKEWAREYRQDNDLTWHHHQDGKRLQLVPFDVHAYVPHSGGASLVKTASSPHE